MILDELNSQEFMSSTKNCTTAMIRDDHVIESRGRRKESRKVFSRLPETPDPASHSSALVYRMVH